MTGTLGNIGCFSFNGNKLITAGGGGMLVNDNREYAEKARFISAQAKAPGAEYYHSQVGYNYRLCNIQAALGVAQLEQIDKFIQKKRYIADRYRELLKDIPGITICGEKQWEFCNYWMISILVDEKLYGMSKDNLLKKLNKAAIAARPFFMPLHNQPPFVDCPKGDIKAANRFYEQGINLPCSVGITDAEIREVALVIKAA